MAQTEKSPAIRFKGFEDKWEEKKLGAIGDTFTGLAGKTKNDFGHGQGRFVTYMNVFSNPIANSQQIEPIEVDNSQNSVKNGDIFFTTSSETPQEVGMSSVWLGTVENVYLNSFCFGYRPISKLDNFYLAYFLRSPSFRKKMTFLAQGISRYNISKNKVMEIFIAKPSLYEQTQIGNYFKQLDGLIKLQGQKLKTVTNLKKAMLEKMFPKDGADVPDVRFKGFTDKWKKKSLQQIAGNYYGGGTPSTSFFGYWNGDIPWIQSSDLDEDAVLKLSVKKYITQLGLKQSATKLIPENSIAIVTRVGVGKLCIVPFKFTTSQDFFTLSNLSIDVVFGVFAISKTIQRELHAVQGTSIKGITKDELLRKEIYMPSDKKEQQKVGEYFQNLDNLINQSKQKIEQLKHLKHALLEKMFI